MQPALEQAVQCVAPVRQRAAVAGRIEKIGRWRLLGFWIVEVRPLCDRGAVLRPDRVVECEERRKMACDQDDRDVPILETVCVLVDGEVVVQERQRVSERVWGALIGSQFTRHSRTHAAHRPDDPAA